MKFSGFNITKYGAVICILAAAAFFAGIYLLYPDTREQRDAPKDITGKPGFRLEQLRPGWWETTSSIYYEIPARVVFCISQEDQKHIDPEVTAEKIWAEFGRIGDIFNPFDPDSEAARLNSANARSFIPVSQDMYNVLEISGKLWKSASGAFDPTMLPIKQLWNKAAETQQIPSNREILKTIANTGFENISLDKDLPGVKLENKNLRFDFGGIAKGYAVDRVAALLEEQGISAALVSLAGEIRTFGENNGKPWRIGIQHPLDMKSIYGTVSAETDIRVSTSGNYHQPLYIAGREFYHIFDPETGRPVSERIAGVTTLCTSQTASNALLDGAATAITVLGGKAGKQFAENLQIEALIIKKNRNGELSEIMTGGFKDFYEPAGR